MRRVIDEEKGSSQQGDSYSTCTALHHMAKKECAEHIIIASPWLQGARGINSNQREGQTYFKQKESFS
jgi:hypothetical protein